MVPVGPLTVGLDAGNMVATRYNTENWICTTYDSRGRVAQTHVQAYGGNPDRTITNNYAVTGAGTGPRSAQRTIDAQVTYGPVAQ